MVVVVVAVAVAVAAVHCPSKLIDADADRRCIIPSSEYLQVFIAVAYRWTPKYEDRDSAL